MFMYYPTASKKRTFSMRGYQVRANGIRQHYLEFGNPTSLPLVIVPGISSPAATWTSVGVSLSQTRRVLILDVRGRGLSEGGEYLDYSLDACAHDLTAFLASMEFGPVDVLAHSMGGRIALRASSITSDFRRLALIDPPLSGPHHPMRVKELSRYLDILALARSGAGIDELRPFSPKLNDQDMALRAEWLATCEPEAIIAAHVGFTADDIWQDIAKLRVPTMLVAAGDRGLIDDDDIAAFLQLGSHLQAATVNAGHMIPMENWSGFYEALKPFFDLPPTIPPYSRLDSESCS
jgi:N-formylmaleamate deformylase